MHQQAILVSPNTSFANAGTLVNIGTIEIHFASTQLANAGIVYRCADSNCSIYVMAVITQVSKANRKNSPQSYFRAKGQSHVKGCTHQPITPQNSTQPQASMTIPASPNRTSAPTVWVNPTDPANSTAAIGSNASGNLATSTSGGASNARQSTGSGTSQSSSQILEKFATEWKKMNATQQKATQFKAPWNIAGSYHSAFQVLSYANCPDVFTTGQKIYVGMSKSITKTPTGFTIHLQENNSKGQSLEVVISLTAQYVAAVNQLNVQLNALHSSNTPHSIYALGTFSKASSTTLSLQITHPHNIYIA